MTTSIINYGAINIFQEQLDSFLESAKKLEIDGLMENIEDETLNEKHINQKVLIKYNESEKSQTLDDDAPVIPKRKYMETDDAAKIDVSSMTSGEIVEKKKELCISGGGMFSCTECEYVTKERSHMNKHIETHFLGQYIKARDLSKIDVSSMNSEEIVEKRQELCQKIDGMFFCTECEYVTKDRSNVRKHIEAHFVGLVYRCNHCNQEFSMHNALIKHKSIEHKKQKGF